MYLAVSSTTIPEPLSACFMTIVGSLASSVKAPSSDFVRLGLNALNSNLPVCSLTLSRYISIRGEALGGIQLLFCLKGCGVCRDQFLK